MEYSWALGGNEATVVMAQRHSSSQLLELEQALCSAKRKTEALFHIYRTAKAMKQQEHQQARSTDSEARTSIVAMTPPKRSSGSSRRRSHTPVTPPKTQVARQDDDHLSNGSGGGEGLLLAVNKFLTSHR